MEVGRRLLIKKIWFYYTFRVDKTTMPEIYSILAHAIGPVRSNIGPFISKKHDYEASWRNLSQIRVGGETHEQIKYA